MSFFAAGELILRENAEAVEPLMATNSFLVALNHKWSCYLSTHDGVIQNYLSALQLEKSVKDINRHIPSNVIEMSKKTPVLSFVDMEDHGWCFGILEDGKCTSSVNLSYEYEVQLLMNLGEKLYGDMLAGIMGENVDEVKRVAQEKMPEYINNLFKNINFDKFELFGCEKADIDYLRTILTPDAFIADQHALVKDFKKTLNLESMDFISFDYVVDREDMYHIIAKK